MLLTNRRNIDDLTRDNVRWLGIPAVERTKKGRLFAAWYTGADGENLGNYVPLILSDDDGRTWSEPVAAAWFGHEARAYDECLWIDPLGRLWFVYARQPEHAVWVSVCDDPDAPELIWREPRIIGHDVMLNKPVVTSDGRWLFPVAIWRFDSYYRLDEALRGAATYVSTDKGQTLDFLGRVEVPREISAFDEHNIVEKKDGSLWIMNRTTKGIGESISTDGGRTWSKLQESPIKHTSSRFFLRRLRSGALLLVKNGPLDREVGRSRMTAYLSRDDGATWRGGLVLDERDQVSYPDGGQTEDGAIFVAYDFERYGAREIYVARFTEEDVDAGKAVSERGKHKILVNKATGEKEK